MLVCLVHLVGLVYMASPMQPNKPDKPNRPNEQDRLAGCFSILPSATGNSDSVGQHAAAHRLSVKSAGCSEAILATRNANGG